ncbi:hypothetical protein ABZ714_13125 [Streptomyces sp. NPDC006798]|uniref:hypothetical protein n=1 Tax=Streptomyces sp. NPDC006798 TaxID=3155462 RepID=UPI0033D57217
MTEVRFNTDQFRQSREGFFVRRCTKWNAGPALDGSHYRCASFTFTFDVPDSPESGLWTVVAAGPDDSAAYVKAYKHLVAECLGDDHIVRLLEQDQGEPAPWADFGWNDARVGCLLPAWEEK